MLELQGVLQLMLTKQCRIKKRASDPQSGAEARCMS